MKQQFQVDSTAMLIIPVSILPQTPFSSSLPYNIELCSLAFVGYPF